MVLGTVEEVLGGTHVQHLLVVLGFKSDLAMILCFFFFLASLKRDSAQISV